MDSLVLLRAAPESMANLAPGAQLPVQVGQGLSVCVCVRVCARACVCVCVCVTRTYIGWGIFFFFFRALDCEDEAAHPQSACSQPLPGKGAEPGCGSARALRARAARRARESSRAPGELRLGCKMTNLKFFCSPLSPSSFQIRHDGSNSYRLMQLGCLESVANSTVAYSSSSPLTYSTTGTEFASPYFSTNH